MDKWVVEFTVEKEGGTVRHEEFECDNWMGVKRLMNVFKVNKVEKIIHVDARLVKTLF